MLLVVSLTRCCRRDVKWLLLVMVSCLRVTALEGCVEKNSEDKSSFFAKECCCQLAMSARNRSERIMVQVPCFNHQNFTCLRKDNRNILNRSWHFILQHYSQSSVQLLSRVQLFVTLSTATCQASLSITNSQDLSKLMSITSVMPSSHLILCHPHLLLPLILTKDSQS